MNQRHLLHRQRRVNSGGLALSLACVLCVMLFQSASAVVLPYSTTFPDSTGWTPSSSGTPASWSVVPGGYQSVIGTGSGFYSFTVNDSSVVASGMGVAVPANSFVATTHFAFTNATGGTYYAGLGALGTTPAFYGPGTSYQARVNNDGYVEILSFNNNSAARLADGNFTGLSLNTSYELQLAGNYDALGNLTLTFSVIDSAHTLTAASIVATIANASVSTGNYFGVTTDIVNTAGAPSTSATTLFSDYSIALVPEPTTYALILVGALLCVAGRRWSKAGAC